MRNHLITVFVVGAALVGCGPSSVLNDWEQAEISDADALRRWSGSSAPQLFFSTMLLTSALLEIAEESTGGCPARTENDGTAVLTGGCTDGEGNEWSGKLTVSAVDEEAGTANLKFEEFGYLASVACENGQTASERLTMNGTTVSEPTDEAGQIRFSYDLRIDQTGVDDVSCEAARFTRALNYKGTRTEAGSAVTWNGSGRVGEESEGTIEASTEDEVINSSECSHEALSGTTTLKGKNSTSVITYDGATDCNEASTVTWTLDGVEMGTVTGISCAAAVSGTPAGFALAGLVLLVLRRRRQ